MKIRKMKQKIEKRQAIINCLLKEAMQELCNNKKVEKPNKKTRLMELDFRDAYHSQGKGLIYEYGKITIDSYIYTDIKNAHLVAKTDYARGEEEFERHHFPEPFDKCGRISIVSERVNKTIVDGNKIEHSKNHRIGVYCPVAFCERNDKFLNFLLSKITRYSYGSKEGLDEKLIFVKPLFEHFLIAPIDPNLNWYKKNLKESMKSIINKAYAFFDIMSSDYPDYIGDLRNRYNDISSLIKEKLLGDITKRPVKELLNGLRDVELGLGYSYDEIK